MNTQNSDVLLATIRLDDDDAVPRQFLEKILKYQENELIGYALTFADGYLAIYSSIDKKIISFKEQYYPKIAIGLTFFNKYNCNKKIFEINYGSVYALGKHTAIDKKVPVILDSTFKGFIRTIHNQSDSYKLWKEKVKKFSDVSTQKIINDFDLSKEVLNITGDGFEKTCKSLCEDVDEVIDLTEACFCDLSKLNSIDIDGLIHVEYSYDSEKEELIVSTNIDKKLKLGIAYYLYAKNNVVIAKSNYSSNGNHVFKDIKKNKPARLKVFLRDINNFKTIKRIEFF